jgi:hypothetical protein
MVCEIGFILVELWTHLDLTRTALGKEVHPLLCLLRESLSRGMLQAVVTQAPEDTR